MPPLRQEAPSLALLQMFHCLPFVDHHLPLPHINRSHGNKYPYPLCSVLIGRFTFKETFDSTRCGVAIIFDDIINGNVTLDEKNYFIGLEQLKN